LTKNSKYVINRLVIVDTNQRMDWTRVRIPTAPPKTHYFELEVAKATKRLSYLQRGYAEEDTAGSVFLMGLI